MIIDDLRVHTEEAFEDRHSYKRQNTHIPFFFFLFTNQRFIIWPKGEIIGPKLINMRGRWTNVKNMKNKEEKQMARVIEVEEGKTVLISKGGFENNRKFQPEKMEVKLPIKEIERWETQENKSTGYGVHGYIVCEDANGKQFLVYDFSWDPNPDNLWREEWESVTDDPVIIQNVLTTKLS